MPMRSLHEDGVRLLRAVGEPSPEALVVAVAPGGVALGHAVARAAGASLDVVFAARLHAPAGPAVGGLAEGGAMVVDDDALTALHLSLGDLDPDVERGRRRLAAAAAPVRAGAPVEPLAGRTVILVDAVVKSGLTARAAAAAMLARRAGRVVVATPLCSAEARAALVAAGHQVVALETAPADEVAALDAGRPRPPAATEAQLRALLARSRRDAA